MTVSDLRTRVGWLLLGSHLLIAAAVVLCFFWGGFLFEEMTTALALISPVFAVHASAAFRVFMAQPHAADPPPTPSLRVNPSFIALTLGTPSVLTLAIFGFVAAKAYNLLTFKQFKNMLAALKAGFGVYLGAVASRLFDGEVTRSSAS